MKFSEVIGIFAELSRDSRLHLNMPHTGCLCMPSRYATSWRRRVMSR